VHVSGGNFVAITCSGATQTTTTTPAATTSTTAPVCGHAGASCTGALQCCTLLCDPTSGQCLCGHGGDTCAADGDCCPPDVCQAGTCMPPCGAPGAPCTSAPECCTLLCDLTSGQCLCGHGGDTCLADRDCCPPDGCQGGTCTPPTTTTTAATTTTTIFYFPPCSDIEDARCGNAANDCFCVSTCEHGCTLECIYPVGYNAHYPGAPTGCLPGDGGITPGSAGCCLGSGPTGVPCCLGHDSDCPVAGGALCYGYASECSAPPTGPSSCPTVPTVPNLFLGSCGVPCPP
jgi:hypothetical protein